MATAKKTGAKDAATFEENLAALSAIVARLEHGDIALDESMALYEEGMRYAERMNAQLKRAAGKVTALEKKRAGFEESPFEAEADSDGQD